MEYKKNQFFQKTGAWLLLLLGAGHLITMLVAPRSEAQLTMFEKMRQFSIPMPGGHPTLLSFYTGFSLMMGFLLIAYGALNLLITGVLEATSIRQRWVALLNLAFAGIALAISIVDFFAVPIFFTLAAMVCYGVALIFTLKAR